MTRRERSAVEERVIASPVTETVVIVARARASFADLGWEESHWEAYLTGWIRAWRAERMVAA